MTTLSSLFSVLTVVFYLLCTATKSHNDYELFEAELEFESYTCFTDDDIVALNLTAGQRSMGKGVHIHFDEWGLGALASAIIMRELLGFNVTLWYFYIDAFKILDAANKSMAILEIYKRDFDIATWMEYTVDRGNIRAEALGVQSFSSMYAPNELVEYARTQEVDFATDLWMEFWKTYSHPGTIDFMNHTDDIIVPMNNGTWPCDETFEYYECINSTWIPPQCSPNRTVEINGTTMSAYDNCTVLLALSPYYDLGLHQTVISETNLSIVIKYVGGEDTSFAIDYFTQYSAENTLYALWEPSVLVSSDRFQMISLPTSYVYDQSQMLYKLIPDLIADFSGYAYEFLLSVYMTNDDYDWIYTAIYQESGFSDNSQSRIDQVCQWLKATQSLTNNTNDWRSWIPDFYAVSEDCSVYTDEQLDAVIDLASPDTDNYDITSDKIQSILQTAAFPDLWTAIQVHDICLIWSENWPTSLKVVQGVAIAVACYILIMFGVTIYCRNEVIIKAACYPLLLLFLSGSFVGACVPLLAYPTAILYCFEIISLHTCIIVMFGSLVGKSWRLDTIIKRARKGQETNITTTHIIVRLMGIVLVTYVYWAVAFAFFIQPRASLTVHNRVVYRHVDFAMDEYIWHFIMICCEAVFIAWGARLAWTLRSVNPQFNESKHIAVTLYHTFLIVGLILIFFVLDIDAHTRRALWCSVWLIMIIFAVSALMGPKFLSVYRGEQFIDRGLFQPSHYHTKSKKAKQNGGDNKAGATQQSGSLLPPTLTKAEVRQLASTLRKLGYEVVKKDVFHKRSSKSTTLSPHKPLHMRTHSTPNNPKSKSEINITLSRSDATNRTTKKNGSSHHDSRGGKRTIWSKKEDDEPDEKGSAIIRELERRKSVSAPMSAGMDDAASPRPPNSAESTPPPPSTEEIEMATTVTNQRSNVKASSPPPPELSAAADSETQLVRNNRGLAGVSSNATTDEYTHATEHHLMTGNQLATTIQVVATPEDNDNDSSSHRYTLDI